jgi:hypothetical protein
MNLTHKTTLSGAYLQLNDTRVEHYLIDLTRLWLRSANIEDRYPIYITREEAEIMAVIFLHFAQTGELLTDVDTPAEST